MPDKTSGYYVCEIVLSSTILEPASALFPAAVGFGVQSVQEDTLEEDIPGTFLHHVADMRTFRPLECYVCEVHDEMHFGLFSKLHHFVALLAFLVEQTKASVMSRPTRTVGWHWGWSGPKKEASQLESILVSSFKLNDYYINYILQLPKGFGNFVRRAGANANLKAKVATPVYCFMLLDAFGSF